MNQGSESHSSPLTAHRHPHSHPLLRPVIVAWCPMSHFQNDNASVFVFGGLEILENLSSRSKLVSYAVFI